MINWIKTLFNKKETNEITVWRTKDSIFKFIQTNIGEDGSLTASAQTLPDEKKTDSEVSFAPGLMDSMFGADESEESKNRARKLSNLLITISKNGHQQSQFDFYTEITENENVIGIIDDFLHQVIQSSMATEPYLYNFAYHLATETNNRNSVKFGLAILGLCQNKTPISKIKILGLHDEFTIFSTIAIANLSGNVIKDLWELAKHVDGWGKIQLVDRLAEMDLPEEIVDWLIYEGYKNNIMYEYLALTCAVNGRLNDKLSKPSIPSKLFKSAGEIIETLFNEGPAAGISAYEDAASTIGHYIKHAKTQILDIGEFIILNRIKEYLEYTTNHDWEMDDLSNDLIDINQILQSKDWTADTFNALKSSDSMQYWNGKQAAQKLNIDLWDTFWNRLSTHPLDSSTWFDITRNVQPENVKKVVEQATRLIPLAEISTGPQNSMGIGPLYQKHQSLEYVITMLGDHPTIGQELLLLGLKSPVIRTRNMTLQALEKWTSDHWTKEIEEALIYLKKIEPNVDTKKNLVQLLNGEELS